MTHLQLQQLPWRFQSSLALEHKHVKVYDTRIEGVFICKYVYTLKRNGTFGRSYTHYLFDGNVYKSHCKVIEAINQYQNEQGDNRT